MCPGHQEKERCVMSEEFKMVSEEELEKIAGGVDGMVGLYDGPYKTVSGIQTGYLALRSDPSYNARNEIGQLNNGDRVKVCGNDAITDHDFDKGYTSYTWVYSPRLNKSGWVNSRFIR